MPKYLSDYVNCFSKQLTTGTKVGAVAAGSNPPESKVYKTSQIQSVIKA